MTTKDSRQPGSARGSSSPGALKASMDTQMILAEPIHRDSQPEAMPAATPPMLAAATSTPV